MSRLSTFPFSETTLIQREPVWLALSELWLDTELSPRDLKHIAMVLADSKLPLAELECIYREEVAPVVYLNLQSVAGEWVGFNPQWLSQAIVQNLSQHSWRNKFLWRLPLMHSRMFFATQVYWEQIKKLLQACNN